MKKLQRKEVIEMADIKIEGLEEFQKAFKDVRKKAPERIEKKAKEITEKVKDDAKENTPVRTGKLKKSIKASKPEQIGKIFKGKVYSDAPHSHLIEEGHRLVSHKGENWGWVDGFFMLEKAAQKKNKELPRELQSWLSELYKELEG